jgi:transposase
MSKNGWRQLKKCFIIPDAPSPKGGRPPADLQEVINAILYVVKAGCSWRSLPHDLVCWQTAFGYFNCWSKDGTWELLREKKPELLAGWIQQAKTSGIIALKNFAQELEGDYEAVKAAATYTWSNGPGEGQVNRLKTIKRQMYGRADFELLSKRVLYYAGTG